MSKAGNKPDLEGAGLQSLNLQLARRLKRREVAYASWPLFLFGAHRFYLDDYRHAWLYPATTIAASAAYALGAFTPAMIVAAGIVLFALRDLWWIDRRVTAMNKRIRMDLFLKRGATPPPGYRGRPSG